MSLDRYRRPRLLVLHPRSTAYDAARAMADHHFGTVLVREGGAIVGIVTDRDLVLEVIAAGLDPKATSLAEIMTAEVSSIDVGASPADAARAMRDHACRRLPVTEDGDPVGVVALDDLLHDGEIDLAAARAIIIAQLDSVMEASAAPPPGERRARVRHRRQARAESSLHRLLKAVERDAGITDPARAEQALRIVLGAVCRRLTPAEARHFGAQLPSKLHAELAECMDGPDKRITIHSIETELARELELGEGAVADVLYGVCDALTDAVSLGEIEAVRGQLPAGMKELFPPRPYRRAG